MSEWLRDRVVIGDGDEEDDEIDEGERPSASRPSVASRFAGYPSGGVKLESAG